MTATALATPWIDLLRASCTVTSQAHVARKIGYSQAVVCQVLSGTYNGDLQRVRAAVEGALMNVQVDCPVLGLISRAKCVEIQRRPFTPTNPANVALYRACRSGCPHSFLPPTCRVSDPSAAQPAVAHNTGSAGAVSQRAAISHGVTAPTGRRKRPTHTKPGNKS